jgi:hypothetical protein
MGKVQVNSGLPKRFEKGETQGENPCVLTSLRFGDLRVDQIDLLPRHLEETSRRNSEMKNLPLRHPQPPTFKSNP